MSQISRLSNGVTPVVTLVYLSGDAGGYVGVDGANNINLLTGDGLATLGTPLSNTITFSLSDDMAAIEALAGTGLPSRTAANTWTLNSITSGGILVGGAGNTITNIGPLTNGELLIGSTGAAPVAGSISSSGGTITVTPGAGTINLEAASSVPTTFTAEDASTATPIANILNIVGTSTNGINTTAAGNTVTISMASSLYSDFSFINLAPNTPRYVYITNTDISAVSSSELRLSVPPGGADAMMVWEVQGTRFYSIGVDNSDGDAWKLTNSSDPSSGDALIKITPTGVVTLYNDLDVTEGGTGVSTLTSHGILLGNGTGDIQATAEPSDGQLLIGDTGGFPILGSLSQPAAGITITGGAGSITFALANDLAAVEGLGTTGLVSRTAADTWATSSITQYALLYGNNTQGVTNLGPLIDGQLVIGSTGLAPVASTLTAGSGIGIANAAGSITISAGATVPTTFTAEDASTCVPALNNLNIVGTATNGINTTAAGSTMTIAMASPYSDGDFTFSTATAGTDRALTVSNSDNSAAASAAHIQVTVGGATSTGDPYTNYLVTGAGTYSVGIDNSDSDEFKITTGASPSAGTELFTMTSAGVITLANDLDVSEGGTGVSTLTSHGILMGNGAGDIQATAEPSNGQILIGSTGNFPTLGTLTAGAGIAITNAAGSVTIANSSCGFTWTDATDATYTLAAQNGYVTNRAGGVTYTLPASGTLGDVIKVVGKAGLATIAQNANQQIVTGNTNTTVGVGGSLAATDAGDCVSLVCITAGASTVWRTDTLFGNWTVT